MKTFQKTAFFGMFWTSMNQFLASNSHLLQSMEYGVATAYSTNENPSTDKLSRAINQGVRRLMEKNILNFQFLFLNTSLIQKAFFGLHPKTKFLYLCWIVLDVPRPSRIPLMSHLTPWDLDTPPRATQASPRIAWDSEVLCVTHLMRYAQYTWPGNSLHHMSLLQSYITFVRIPAKNSI